MNIQNLHVIQFQILKEIKRICEKNSIPFFLIDGTALGAYYLKDFLPWDDDLDIGMYYSDYLRFIDACANELGDNFMMKDFTTNDTFGCAFGQLINKDYPLSQRNNYMAKDKKGVFVDVHPFIDGKSSAWGRNIDFYLFKGLKVLLLIKRKYADFSLKKYRIIQIISFCIPEKVVIKLILLIRNRKLNSEIAVKIHGRHREDYIYKCNLTRLEKIVFNGESFPVMPDIKRMLDGIYGEFDLSYSEDNRHQYLEI